MRAEFWQLRSKLRLLEMVHFSKAYSRNGVLRTLKRYIDTEADRSVESTAHLRHVNSARPTSRCAFAQAARPLAHVHNWP
jgi:hypothetical protein